MISTKILVPRRREDTLYRQRLVDRIRQRIRGAMTMISAPAGYGKTSLILDVCHDDDFPYPVCWLSLDESDCDIYVFVHNLIAAIQRRFPDFGKASLRALKADPELVRKPDALGQVVLQDLLENISDFFVLVLDDFHTIDRIGRAGRLLGDMAMSTSRRWHIIVSGRTSPGILPFTYLVAHDLIVFVGQEHLAFTSGEVQQMLAMRHKLDLTPEEAKALVAASEGWITGIVLAIGSAWRGMRDVLNQAKMQDGLVYNYLAKQAFEAEPLYYTMLAMSTLPEMSERLCRQALGLTGADGVLQELERRGIFLTTVEDDVGVRYYRYHHLFRDFLQNNLREKDPNRFARLHQLAADWFESQEQWERAVVHRQAAGDKRAMAQTMESGAKSMCLSGRLDTLIHWYETIPESLRTEVPRLSLFAGRALFDLGQVTRAIPLLYQAKTIFDKRGETEQKFPAMLQLAAVRHVQGRYAEMLDIAQGVLESATDSAFIAEAYRLTGLASLYLGRPEASVEYLLKALDLHQELGARDVAITCLDLSLALLRLGRLNEGWSYQSQAAELLRQLGPSHYLAMTLNNIACEQHYLTGNYGQALICLREALDIAQMSGSPRARAFVLLSTADIYRDLGSSEKAWELYTQAEEITQQLAQADLLGFALLSTAQILLQTGSVAEAQGRAAQAYDQASLRDDVYQIGLSCLMLGAISLETGAPHKSLDEVKLGLDQLIKSGARRDLTRAYILLARAYQAAGDEKSALEALSQALNVGVETHTFRHLTVEGQNVIGLLRHLIQQNPVDRRPAQIMNLIRDLPDVARQVTASSTASTVLFQRPTIRFYGFGPGRVEKDGKTITWRTTKSCYLMFYFLMNPTRTREQVFTVFWPDKEVEPARSAFHYTKTYVKKALGRQFINYRAGQYQFDWDPDCWFDMIAFESLVNGREGNRQNRLEQAIALYQGDLLSGYDAEWILPIRERLRLRLLDALMELGEIYVERGKYELASSALNRAVALDDFYEPAIQALLRLHILDKQPRSALDVFHRFEQRLQQIGKFPEPETQLLYHSIRSSPM